MEGVLRRAGPCCLPCILSAALTTSQQVTNTCTRAPNPTSITTTTTRQGAVARRSERLRLRRNFSAAERTRVSLDGMRHAASPPPPGPAEEADAAAGEPGGGASSGGVLEAI